MSFLRSSLFIAIVSLFVLTGYAADVLDYGCGGEEQEQSAKIKTASSKSVPVNQDDCQCICHQIFIAAAAGPVRAVPAVLTAADFFADGAKFPPDAVPLGIDYPPQLA